MSSGVGFPIVFKTVTEGENILPLTSLEQISDELNEAETPKRTLHDFTRRLKDLKRLADSIIRLLSELASMNIIDSLKSP